MDTPALSEQKKTCINLLSANTECRLEDLSRAEREREREMGGEESMLSAHFDDEDDDEDMKNIMTDEASRNLLIVRGVLE